MQRIQLGKGDYDRSVAKEARIMLRNRYFEANPVLTEEPTALLARPGLARFVELQNEGPIRATYSSPGVFDDDLFVVCGLNLFRVKGNGTFSLIGEVGTNFTSGASMAATAPIGDVPAYLYIADGGVLWCYTEDGYARGTLSASGAIAADDTVTIDTTVYKLTGGSVDTGTPDGSAGNPWLVKLGITIAETIFFLFKAINDSGTPGTDYSTALTPHATAQASAATTDSLVVRALALGAAGNTLATTETGVNLSWGAATLTDGGTPSLFQVPTPDDVGALDVAHIASYIIVIPAQNESINGRFWWINPGETTIDPIDFATAERSPDPIYQVVVFGDQFWLLGQTTTEPWLPTGNPDAPMQRFQGVLFDRGTWEGTAVQVKDSLILVDSDGGVFQVGGGIRRISRPDIEERIRRAIGVAALQRSL